MSRAVGERHLLERLPVVGRAVRRGTSGRRCGCTARARARAARRISRRSPSRRRAVRAPHDEARRAARPRLAPARRDGRAARRADARDVPAERDRPPPGVAWTVTSARRAAHRRDARRERVDLGPQRREGRRLVGTARRRSARPPPRVPPPPRAPPPSPPPRRRRPARPRLGRRRCPRPARGGRARGAVEAAAAGVERRARARPARPARRRRPGAGAGLCGATREPAGRGRRAGHRSGRAVRRTIRPASRSPSAAAGCAPRGNARPAPGMTGHFSPRPRPWPRPTPRPAPSSKSPSASSARSSSSRSCSRSSRRRCAPRSAVVTGLFRFRTTRRLIGDLVVAGRVVAAARATTCWTPSSAAATTRLGRRSSRAEAVAAPCLALVPAMALDVRVATPRAGRASLLVAFARDLLDGRRRARRRRRRRRLGARRRSGRASSCCATRTSSAPSSSTRTPTSPRRAACGSRRQILGRRPAHERGAGPHAPAPPRAARVPLPRSCAATPRRWWSRARPRRDRWTPGAPFDVAAAMNRARARHRRPHALRRRRARARRAVSAAPSSRCCVGFDRSQFPLADKLAWLPAADRPPHAPAPGRRSTALVYGLIADAPRDGHGPATRDLLSMLLDARDEETGEAMTDLEVRDEALTLLLAGPRDDGRRARVDVRAARPEPRRRGAPPRRGRRAPGDPAFEPPRRRCPSRARSSPRRCGCARPRGPSAGRPRATRTSAGCRSRAARRSCSRRYFLHRDPRFWAAPARVRRRTGSRPRRGPAGTSLPTCPSAPGGAAASASSSRGPRPCSCSRRSRGGGGCASTGRCPSAHGSVTLRPNGPLRDDGRGAEPC